MAEPTQSGPTLQTYSAFVRRRRGLLLLAVVVAAVIGGALHQMKPLRYTSTAHLVILSSTETPQSDGSANISIDSALQLLRSDEVLGPVAETLMYPGGPSALDEDLTLRPIINSRIVRLSVSAPTPDLAAAAASSVTQQFLDIRRGELKAVQASREQLLSDELSAVEEQLDDLYLLHGTAEMSSQDPDAAADASQDPAARIGPLVSLRAQLHGDLAALSISEPNPGYLSRPATHPVHGQRSGLAITMASALVLSLLAAVGAGALLEMRQAPT